MTVSIIERELEHTLTIVQARCTELLLENRALRAQQASGLRPLAEPRSGSFADEAILCYQRSVGVFKEAADAREQAKKKQKPLEYP